MKKLEKYFYHTTAYTVLIALAFFLFARLSGAQYVDMAPGRFLLIILFSLVISVSESLFAIRKLPKPLAYAIHFTALYLTFLVVFVAISESDKTTPAFIFAALIIFGAVYFSALGIILLLKKLKAESSTKKSSKQKPSYKPRYK